MFLIARLFALYLSIFLLYVVSATSPSCTSQGLRRSTIYRNPFFSPLREIHADPSRSTDVETERIPQIFPKGDLISAIKGRRENRMGSGGIKKARSSRVAIVTAAQPGIQSEWDAIARKYRKGRFTLIDLEPVEQESSEEFEDKPAQPETAVSTPSQPIQRPLPVTEHERRVLAYRNKLRMQNIYIFNDTFDMIDVPHLVWMPTRDEIIFMIDPETGEY